jgi:hypothetical protein
MSTQVLTTPSAGQARIESVPVGVLNNLVTTIPGFFFDEAVFNLDATANGSANITALDQFGASFNFLLPLSGWAELLHAYNRGWRTHLQCCVHNYRWFGQRSANSIWGNGTCTRSHRRRRPARSAPGCWRIARISSSASSRSVHDRITSFSATFRWGVVGCRQSPAAQAGFCFKGKAPPKRAQRIALCVWGATPP